MVNADRSTLARGDARSPPGRAQESRVTARLGISEEMLLGLPDEVLDEEGRLASLEVRLPSKGAQPDRRAIQAGVSVSIPLLSPALFNMRRVRAAQLPAANLHCSARALAKFYAGLASGAEGPLLAAETLESLCSSAPLEAGAPAPGRPEAASEAA